MKKILSAIIAMMIVTSSTVLSYGNESIQSKLYTYKMDMYDNLKIDTTLKYSNNISKEQKLQEIINNIEKINFKNLNIELIKIENNVVYVDLQESKNAGTTWKQMMSGSYGGYIASQEILCNILQPNYYGDWVKGVYITYEGNSENDQMGFDHVGMDFFGNINTKASIKNGNGLDVSIFKDTSKHWAKHEIEKFYGKDYIGGYEDNTFRADNKITRAEFVKIFNKYFGLINSSGKEFKDTKQHWAKHDIDVAVTNGVCNGKTQTEFKPNDFITREEAAVMIANYKKIADINLDKLSKYNDANKVSDWAKSSIEGNIENGYLGGYSDNTIKPKNNITRAEAVVMISRVN